MSSMFDDQKDAAGYCAVRMGSECAAVKDPDGQTVKVCRGRDCMKEALAWASGASHEFFRNRRLQESKA